MRKIVFLLLGAVLFFGCSGNGPELPEDANSFDVTLPDIVYNNEEVSVRVTGDNMVKVELYISDELVKSIVSPPYTSSIVLSDMKVGKHTLMVIAEYGDGKKDKKTFDFQFKVKEGTDYQGGLVVYLNEKGDAGVISSKEDLTAGSIAGLYYFDFDYGRGVEYDAYSKDDGKKNTSNVPAKNEADMAFKAVKDYKGGGYDDWYVPAFNEFEYLKKYDKQLGLDVSSKLYWTSTLKDGTHAYLYCFGRCAFVDKDMELNRYHYVRPIRRF